MPNTRNQQPSVDKISSSKLSGVIQITEFQKTKLPTTKEVIGRVYDVVSREKSTFSHAISVVANELSKHWTDRNVYPVSINTVIKRITHCIDGTGKEPGYRKVKSISEEHRSIPSYVKHCDRLNVLLDTLFDVFCENQVQRKKLELTCPKMKSEDWQVHLSARFFY